MRAGDDVTPAPPRRHALRRRRHPVAAVATAALAAETEAAGTPPNARVTQRELDLGNGAVVHLVGVVYRAFREATAALPALVVPPLGELARFFARPAAKAPAAKPPAPTPDPDAPTG